MMKAEDCFKCSLYRHKKYPRSRGSAYLCTSEKIPITRKHPKREGVSIFRLPFCPEEVVEP